jgi:hypothetical protein
MRKKLYPSSSAFMIGELVVTDYDSGCLRAILLAANGARTEIPEIYMKVGAAHEDWYEETVLKKDPRIITYATEVPIKLPIPGVEGVLYSGRMDVLAAHEKVGTVIHETKGTISKNTRLAVIRKGKVKLNQLAQLVSYMIAKECTRGKLVVGYYEDEDGSLVHQEGRDFKVEIDEDGSILIDGERYEYTVAHQMAHRQAAARTLVSGEIAERPANWDQKWGGPCGNCTFREVCNKFDRGELDGSEFITAGRAAARDADSNRGPEPEPFTVRKAKVSKLAKAKRSPRGNKAKPKETN